MLGAVEPPALVVVDAPDPDRAALGSLLDGAVGPGLARRTAVGPRAGWVRVVLGAADPDRVVADLRAAAAEPLRSGRWRLAVAVPDDAEFADEWRPWLRPRRIGRHLVVVPAGQEPPGDRDVDDVVVRIGSGPAFGAGAHPSTGHALTLVEALVPPARRVLDVGTGSGILAVTAALLGAEAVVACDVDPAAIPATTANAEANGVADRVEVTGTPVGDLGGTHDLVVANIESAVLAHLAPELAARVSPGGDVVLAGLLDGPDRAVAAAWDALGWAVVDELTGPDDWRAWRLRRRGLSW